MDNSKQQQMDNTTYRNFVAGQLRGGKDQTEVVQRLMQMGMDVGEAGRLVDIVRAEVAPTIKASPAPGGALMTAILGGGIAAVVGGGLWGLITAFTGFVIGYMAIGVGALCGYGVARFSQGAKGVSFQLVALMWAIFGILIGHYTTVIITLKRLVMEKSGPEAAARIGFLSAKCITFFVHNMVSFMSPFDALWILLAIGAAWRISESVE